jgi:hypothetical protein
VSPLEDVAQKMRRTSEEITRLVGDLASELSAAGHVVGNDEANARKEIDHLSDLLERTREQLIVSERNRERFRYALWVYLQEKDGLVGSNAPTPETLKLIRELIQELQ